MEKHIFDIKNENEFNKLALKVFKFQYENNIIYHKYVGNLKILPDNVKNIHDIPFLPVSFFKSHSVVSSPGPYEAEFISSGTTDLNTSKHFVKSLKIYEQSFIRSFQSFYGNPQDYCFLALLPSYMERSGSSLVYMMQKFIQLSNYEQSGFYLNEFEKLKNTIEINEKQKIKTILLGVSYALLDFAEKYSFKLKKTIVMETGGMKGRRKELTKHEMHNILVNAFGVETIHSEYGMTELLSQSYSKGKGIFFTPPWMKILIRDQYDPFDYVENGKSGGINIIDLANINSCSFIETQDLGRRNEDGSFEVVGRFDFSDVRGCNLMVE